MGHLCSLLSIRKGLYIHFNNGIGQWNITNYVHTHIVTHQDHWLSLVTLAYMSQPSFAFLIVHSRMLLFYKLVNAKLVHPIKELCW